MFTTELLSLMIRVSLLLAVGNLVARLLERKSAAMAHRVLVMTLACALASFDCNDSAWLAMDSAGMVCVYEYRSG
ncbi:MAG: hypothetical protein WKF77_21040 [Planctomycetaceae bacterium]